MVCILATDYRTSRKEKKEKRATETEAATWAWLVGELEVCTEAERIIWKKEACSTAQREAR
jgi:hypothetical protein